MRIVIDTDALVAALRSDQGASRRLLLLALNREIEPVVSVPLVLQYEAVLKRQDHLQAAALRASDVDVILDALIACSRRVKLAFLWRPLLADADDDMVLETAMNGSAEYLVSFNKRDFRLGCDRLGLALLSPSEALRAIGR